MIKKFCCTLLFIETAANIQQRLSNLDEQVSCTLLFIETEIDTVNQECRIVVALFFSLKPHMFLLVFLVFRLILALFLRWFFGG